MSQRRRANGRERSRAQPRWQKKLFLQSCMNLHMPDGISS
ncbi:hypothetical protein DDI_4080 [Dickeya dianthicola RNS04.9]|nr:hypothetical protein DDI_4080 [Dickeya dianthicola RNS04.9]